MTGIEFLHAQKIAHRDLKPENLLLDKTMKTIKIVDFGLSNIYKDEFGESFLLKTACGSPCYAAPEMVAGNKYKGYTVDIWSSGITLYAMICGYLPFEEAETALLYQKILKGYYEIPSFLTIQAVQIIKGLLTVDPEERLDFEQIKKEPWIQQGIPPAPEPLVAHRKNHTCDTATLQKKLTPSSVDDQFSPEPRRDIKINNDARQNYLQEANAEKPPEKRPERGTSAPENRTDKDQIVNQEEIRINVISQLATRTSNVRKTKVNFANAANKTTALPPTKVNMFAIPEQVASPEHTISSHQARSNSCTGGSDAGKVPSKLNYYNMQVLQGTIPTCQLDIKKP